MVWRENGLEKEPPILSQEEKRALMVRWFNEDKLYHVMGHDEMVDYNLNTPIMVKPTKVQPKVWHMNEDTPRHSARLLFNKLDLRGGGSDDVLKLADAQKVEKVPLIENSNSDEEFSKVEEKPKKKLASD